MALKSKQWFTAAFEKAVTDEKGEHHLILHATGLQQDSKGLTLSEEGKGVLIEAGKKGLLTVTPSHHSPIEFARSCDAHADDKNEVFIDNLVDAADHQAMKVFAGVQDGTFMGEVSTGGDCTVDKLNKTYTPLVYGVNSDNPKHQVHQALVMPNRASYPGAGPVSAFSASKDMTIEEVKAFLCEKTGVAWDSLTSEQEAALVTAFSNGMETYDASSALDAVMSIERGARSLGYLLNNEKLEAHAEAAAQISALEEAIAKATEAAKAAKTFIASEILEDQAEVEVVSTGGVFLLSKDAGGVVSVAWKPTEKTAPEPAKLENEKTPITLSAPEGWTPSDVTAFMNAMINFKADGAPPKAAPLPDTNAFENQISELKGQVEAMSNELAKANDVISAWKPLMDVVAETPIPTGSVVSVHAFSKEKDAAPSSAGGGEAKPPANSLEAIQQAQAGAQFIKVR